MGSSIVALNAGSSSLKFAVYDARDPQEPRCRGQLEGIGASPHLKVVDADGIRTPRRRGVDSNERE